MVRKILVNMFGLVFRSFRKILGSGGQGFLKELLEKIEDQEKVFITYHTRPMSSALVCDRSDEGAAQQKLGIIIQGPIVNENDFTLETIKIYKKNFRDAVIILSTWDDEPSDVTDQFKRLGIDVVSNKKPDYAGVSHINFQITSAKNGVKRAKGLGVQYALKTRTDQRMYAPNIAEFLYNMTEVFPVVEGYAQKKRIVAASLNTFKYRMYGLSDMFIYGHIDDVDLYWDCPLDQRVFKPEELNKGGTALNNYDPLRVCEAYLLTEFLKKLGREFKWSLEDSWNILKDHFCVVDAAQLDLFWPKYVRREYRWLKYEDRHNFEELSFREWLNMYQQFNNVNS